MEKSARSGIGMVAELAAREGRNAERLEARPAYDKTDAFRKRIEAGWSRGESARLLDALPETLVGDASTELVPGIRPADQPALARLSMVDTLAVPDVISVDASEQRASSATRAGVLSAALDTAKTARAGNSIEKMLCHQLAASHEVYMDLIIRFKEAGFTRMPIPDQVRMVNAAARMSDVFQTGCLTLQKLQSGGKQHVVVQYQQQVNVATGGQAVVAREIRKKRK
jgi:hypothetical protein